MKDLVIDYSEVDLATMKKYPHLLFEKRGEIYV